VGFEEPAASKAVLFFFYSRAFQRKFFGVLDSHGRHLSGEFVCKSAL